MTTEEIVKRLLNLGREAYKEGCARANGDEERALKYGRRRARWLAELILELVPYSDKA